MRPSLGTLPDLELLERMRNGAEEAFTALYRRHQGVVYRYALQMSGKAELAEDITQEVFMALIRNGGRFDPERGALVGYLIGIARNHLLRQRGERAAYLQLTDDEDGSLPGLTQVQAASDNPLGDLTRRESIASLKLAIQALPAHYREVVVLCDLEEFSYQETASVLGCSLGTVRSRLHRAHTLLTNRLKSPTAVGSAASQVKTRCFA